MPQKIKSLTLILFAFAASSCTQHVPHTVEAAAPASVPVAAQPAPEPEKPEYILLWYRGDDQIGAGVSRTQPELQQTTIPTYVFRDRCNGDTEKTFTDQMVNGGIIPPRAHRVIVQRVGAGYDCNDLPKPR